MRDGRTVKRDATTDRDEGFGAWRATLVVIEGPGAGNEFPVGGPRTVIGRATDADLVLPDEAISQEHLAIEFVAGRFRAVDLGSTNGTSLNGETIRSEPIEHGDRIALGGHVLQIVLEKRDGPPPVYELPDL